MNIFLQELKANRKALIIWSVCMFLLVVSGMAKYTAYSAGGAGSNIFSSMPFTMKALLGIGSFDVTSMSGYFAMLFLYIELFLAIHAVLLGNGIIAKEERDKTTEFLIVKPVSRTTIISAKLLAALVNIVIINIFTFVSSLMIIPVYNKGKDISGEIALFFLTLFIVQLIFLSLGAILSAVLRNAKGSGSLSIGILLGAFIVSKITDLTDKVNFLNILSPFKYFSYADIVNNDQINVIVLIISLLLIAAFTTLTYSFYRKRDLNV